MIAWWIGANIIGTLFAVFCPTIVHNYKCTYMNNMYMYNRKAVLVIC